MKYQKYFLFTGLVAAVGLTAFFLVLSKMEPCTAPGGRRLCYSVSGLSLSLFFLSAAVALTGTFTFLGFGLRYWLNRSELYRDHLNVSIRQAILLTLCALGSLALLLLNVLAWWSGLLLIAIIVCIELYFTRP